MEFHGIGNLRKVVADGEQTEFDTTASLELRLKLTRLPGIYTPQVLNSWLDSDRLSNRLGISGRTAVETVEGRWILPECY